MKHLNVNHIGLILAVTFILTGCATTFSEHEEKYKNLNLQSLLNPESVSTENKQLLQESLVQRAQKDKITGYTASAIKHAEMALKFAPESGEAKLILAESHLQQGDFENAESLFAELLSTAPSEIVHQGYGLSLLGQNKTSEAQTWLNEAVKSNVDLWRSWNGLGIINGISNDWELSEKAYKAGIKAAGHKAVIYNNLGLSYMQQNRLAEAVIVFENAHTVSDKDDMNLHYRTAVALSGDLEKAENGATDIELAQLYNNLGTKALDGGQNKKAIAYLKKAIAKSPSHYAKAIHNLDRAQSALP